MGWGKGGEELCTWENSLPHCYLVGLRSLCTPVESYPTFHKTLLVKFYNLIKKEILIINLTLFKCVWFFCFGWNRYVYLYKVVIKMAGSFMFCFLLSVLGALHALSHLILKTILREVLLLLLFYRR